MLDRLSTNLQALINTLLGARGKGRHPIKTLLNGSWLGHPLHPMITDIAIGGIVLAVVSDIAWLAFPVTSVWAPRTAELTLIAGVVGMIGSFVTGWTDWSDTYGPERNAGILHGSLNTLALLLAGAAVVLQLQQASGKSLVAAILTFISVGLIAVAGFVGGELVFKFGTNVNHTAYEHGTDDYQTVGPLANLTENQLTRVVVNDVPVVLLRHGERVAALAATCTHAGGPLDEGMLLPGDVQCPWHASRFRFQDGKIVDGPATVNQPVYDVQIVDGIVAVKRR
jgi:nitrite reductase/ring-hydroxylating ferredoxin subunit/uncharacterized membrane protein